MKRRALFLQVTEAAIYPPIQHASGILADAGWEVVVLTAPLAGSRLAGSPHPGVRIVTLPARTAPIVSPRFFLLYCARALALARRFGPSVIYASDPLGTLPGLLARAVTRARLVYHEHDSPRPGARMHPVPAFARRAILRTADVIVFPNKARADLALDGHAGSLARTRIVWNTPRLTELPSCRRATASPLVLHYHGGISSTLLPEAIPEAVARFAGRVRLQIAGTESPSARGYLARLFERFDPARSGMIDYLGQLDRKTLLARVCDAHVGLAVIRDDDDVNLTNLMGASNKVFDYMAAGLVLLTDSGAAWSGELVAAGHALDCEGRSADSIAAAIGTLLDDPERVARIGALNRRRVEADWNYEAQFAPVKLALEATA